MIRYFDLFLFLQLLFLIIIDYIILINVFLQYYFGHPQRINVWICGGRVIGSFFFDGSLTADVHLDKLQHANTNKFHPYRHAQLIKQNWVKRDGTLSNYGLQLRQYVYNVFPNRW